MDNPNLGSINKEIMVWPESHTLCSYLF